jgi:hypothetical protein
MNFWNAYKLILLATAALILMTSCGIQTKHHRSSSVVQYLYPDKQNYIEVPGWPLSHTGQSSVLT